MFEYLSLEVETRKHAERSKVVGVLNETSIPHPYVALHPEIALVSLLCVPHFWISLERFYHVWQK